MRSFILGLALSTMYSSSYADINDILDLQQAINSFCGTRVSVILVDESHSNPPCLMVYSDGCEETQPDTPQSCLIVMNEEHQQDKMVSVSW
jgi:hypothetical protein